MGEARPRGSASEVFLVFLKLGVSSFGGPIAHLGYFRAEFVERRRWLSERAYVDLVALSQFLPGPASSQTGFAIGLMRGGALGGLAAWAGFTLPSAALLLAFAFGSSQIGEAPWGAGLLHGLKLVAVAIVAQAVLGMARSLCPDKARASIATAALVLLLLAPGSLAQIAAIALGAAAGLVLPGESGSPAPESLAMPISRSAGLLCLTAYFALLALAFVPAGGLLALFAAFYRSGALVFGGGHVVLPLLRDAVVAPGWVSDSAFLAGYGAAQAIPGPLFTFAAYLGAIAGQPPAGIAGALVALVAIFLPGLLALTGALPFWHALRANSRAQAAMRGVNAAVVGLLGAALYSPVWTSAVLAPADFAIAAAGFVLLAAWRAPPLVVVALSAAAGIALAA
ncbi:MAG TPA: chromate efflux transporter [Roseiarcus sp.]|jgi:chromate transporter